MNRRNLSLVIPFNARRNLKNVNEKIICKNLLETGGIPVPRTILVCRTQADTELLRSSIADYPSFVIKPSRGFGGEGILLISRDENGNLVDSDGDQFEFRDILHHVKHIIDGVFSLDNYSDVALIEETIIPDNLLGGLSNGGVPDIRVIVCKNQVISGMLRLPTEMSGGKANLHQGGGGVGIDIETGRTTTSIHKGRFIDQHPDTGKTLGGILVPEWQRILDLSVRIPNLVALGYVGIDYVIDSRRGLLVLEVNGRPGLQIQLANNQGLRERYQEVLDSDE